MKVLYVSVLENSKVTGGSLCRRNNYLALKATGVTLYEYRIELKKSILYKIFLSIFNYKCGVTAFHIKKIQHLLTNESIDLLFLDTSLYGIIAKKLQSKKSTKIITFFHNCEYEIYSQFIKNHLFMKPVIKSVYLNEYYSLKYSNKCIFLNERDYNDCKKIYKINCEKCFSPIALERNYVPKENIIFRIPKKLLFVGSYFYPNIHGLIWFINLVLPYIDYSLTIIGKGFEQKTFLEQLKDKSKIEVKGFVENLDNEYESADIVIQPIFEGSGMKTKTAECFMYGKPLVSTSEGLMGYIEDLENVYCCDTTKAFIETLNKLKKIECPSFCKNLRECFEINYSLDARIENYKKILRE